MAEIKKKKLLAVIVMLFLAVYPAPAFAVKEERLKIVSVEIKGNEVYSDRALKKAMVTRKSWLFKKRYFYRQVLEEDILRIADFYEREGYFDSEVNIEGIDINRENKTAAITLKVYEGARYRIDSISVMGNEFYDKSKILKELKLKTGQYLRRRSLEEATANLMALYGNSGFIEAEINADININRNTETVFIDFYIRENIRYTVNDIKLKGNEKTRPRVLYRELLFNQGEFVNYSKLLESQRNLNRTGLFGSVFIKPQPAEEGYEAKKNIMVEVKEKPSIELALGIGYDTHESFWQEAEISNRNLYGKAQKVGLKGRKTGISREMKAFFTEPRIFGTRWKSNLELFTGFQEEPAYDLTETGGRLDVGRRLGEYIRLIFSGRSGMSKLSNITAVSFTGERDSRTSGIAVSAFYDSRDNIFNASRGSYAELGSEISFSNINFLRTQLKLKHFISLANSGLVLGTAAEIGMLFAAESFYDIPLNERFYAGGPSSIRGLKYNTVSPRDSAGKPVGGKIKLVWNVVEVKIPLFKKLSGAVFFDAGNVWETIGNIDPGDMRTSIGAGLRAETPIGVFRLDYGVNLAPRREEPSGMLFFGSGLAF